jgi:hypothetical protein
MTVAPIRWTDEQIAADVEASTAAFRRQRFAEPLEAWLREVDQRTAEFEQLFDAHDIATPQALTAADIPAIISSGLLDALRYLTGPPISEDDLKSLAEVKSLAPSRLREDPQAAQRLLDVIRATVDPRRFPWLAETREPEPDERRLAIFASALMHAAPRTLMMRRTVAKGSQEQAVRDELAAHGLQPLPLRPIATYADFPPPGVFSRNEVRFGPKKADVLARLWDDRMLPVECKVSNSSVNSFKRLNHETLSKNTAWTDAFGRANVVPAAMLAGVYSPANVVDAQAAGLAIFWSHRINDLGAFVEATR